ncbi:hypothetical protein [Flindersiella endophytica]
MPEVQPVYVGRIAVVIRRGVTAAAFVIAGLSFVFGFGNAWALGLRLHVTGWVAPLVAPAVDLSVLALLAALQYLRANGATGQLRAPRLLLVFCGVVTLALNTAEPILVGAYGRAAFDAVAPLLLIGWGEVGPRLLALLHAGSPDAAVPSSDLVPDDRTEPSSELLNLARKLDAEHRLATGRSISRDKLRAALKVSNATAGELLRAVRQDQG